jgi:patatin-like phospholipase/acyl hydrolase
MTVAIRTIAAVKAELRKVGAEIDAAVLADEPTLAIAMLVRTRYELSDELYALKQAKAKKASSRQS